MISVYYAIQTSPYRSKSATMFENQLKSLILGYWSIDSQFGYSFTGYFVRFCHYCITPTKTQRKWKLMVRLNRLILSNGVCTFRRCLIRMVRSKEDIDDIFTHCCLRLDIDCPIKDNFNSVFGSIFVFGCFSFNVSFTK